ncbi:hypothetical protein B8V81_5055 [Paenibacillus pasadenensis]|uniref:Uncharacterized protein n=1 Tax=Paenibacillus pasadenensis TaxID=217090 RepID=A0A2N5MZJ7_9BACL|nr:hypothetical protein B8V81_5055 [Paenibacillus pasadenensis]
MASERTAARNLQLTAGVAGRIRIAEQWQLAIGKIPQRLMRGVSW